MKRELGISSCIGAYLGGFSEKVFEEYEKNGVKYCELSITNPAVLEKSPVETCPLGVVETAARHGVTFWSFHLPFSRKLHPANLDESDDREAMIILEKYTRIALEMGIKIVVIHPSSEPNEDKERPALLERTIENLAYLSNICRESGAVLAVEDLPRTCLCNHSDEMLKILRAVPELQMTFDTNHISQQPNPVFLQALLDGGMRGRIETIHISDYDGGNERHRLPFDGNNDWAEIARLLDELDYRGVAMYELSKPWDREEYITIPQVVENYKKLCEVTGW